MSDELIRKSDVLDLLDDLGVNLIDYDIYSQLFDTVDNMPPVSAVELPCKVGDTIFTTNGGVISESIVKRITIFKDGCLLTIKDFCLGNDFMIEEWDINPDDENDRKYVFLTREEAEKALEDLKNDK